MCAQHVYVYACVYMFMYVNVGKLMSWHMCGGQSTTMGAGPHLPPSLRQDLFAVYHFRNQVLGIFLSSAPTPHRKSWNYICLQDVSFFYMDTRDFNSGLTTEQHLPAEMSHPLKCVQ